MRVLKMFAVTAVATTSLSAQCADMGLSLAWGNPQQSGYGVNFISIWKNVALEVGVGAVAANIGQRKNNNNLDLSGDIDVKYLFATSSWRPFVEGGFRTGLGMGDSGVSFGAGNPFLGGGVMYWGSKLFGYVGANTDSGKVIFPFVGAGFRF